MKKRDFSDRETYESPAVTLLDVRVEQGFTISFGASSGPVDGDYGTPAGSGSDPLTEEEW